MTDRRGHDSVRRSTAFVAVIATGSKGGRRQKNKMEVFRWGIGGGYGRPFFCACDGA